MKHRKDGGGSAVGGITSFLMGRRVDGEQRADLWRRIGLLAVVGVLCAVLGVPLLLASHRGAPIFEFGTVVMALGVGLLAGAAFQALIRLLGR